MQVINQINQVIETTAVDVTYPVDADEYQTLRAEILTLAVDISEKAKQLSESVLQIGRLLKRMRNKDLYKAEYGTWDQFCRSLTFPGFDGLSYKRANQFIAASETQEYLIDVLNGYKDSIAALNETTLRAIQTLPVDNQAPIVEAVFIESAETGKPPNSRLVSQVASDFNSDYEAIAEQVKDIGEFKRYTPTSNKTKNFRYSFETKGKSALFETLPDAETWLGKYRSTTTQTCLNCAHCNKDERVNPDEIFCTLKGYVVLEERAAIMPSICNTWSNHLYAQTYFDIAPTPKGKDVHPASILTSSAKTGDADPERNERYTPEFLWRPGLDLFQIEEYDLDPASCDQATVPAKTRFTKEQNGLVQTWIAKYLFANFPFSLNLEFTLKFIESIQTGDVENAIICLKTDHRTKWYNHLLYNCSCYCLVNKQVQYINTGHSCFFGSTLFFFGQDELGFFKTHRHLGSVNKTMGADLDILDFIPQEPTFWSGVEIRNLWRKIGNVSERPKYKSGFLVDNEVLDIHFEFQTQSEAWNAWAREKNTLLSKFQ